MEEHTDNVMVVETRAGKQRRIYGRGKTSKRT